ncbi:MAG TPA: permease-like cell division protein FtsX [Ignavibacteriales bacterium]|nr:permease-like cell division protein FtsX [Ignavibacteriales bacterium]
MVRFYIKEIYYNLKKSFGIFLVNLFSIYFATVLFLGSLIIFFVTKDVENQLKNKINLNVFLSDSLSYQDIQSNLNFIKLQPYCKNIKFISKEEAEKKFKQETGEDFSQILSEINPLPASLEIELKDEYLSVNQIEIIKKEINKLKGIEEIRYNKDLVQNMLIKLDTLIKYLFSISFFLIIVSFFILFSNAKLLLINKDNEIETMKLIGAKLTLIRRQFIYYYLFIGFLASILIAITFIATLYFINQINLLFNLNIVILYYIILTIISPIILCWIISFVITRRINLKIKKF